MFASSHSADPDSVSDVDSLPPTGSGSGSSPPSDPSAHSNPHLHLTISPSAASNPIASPRFPLSCRPLFNLVESQLSNAITKRPLLADREEKFLSIYVRQSSKPVKLPEKLKSKAKRSNSPSSPTRAATAKPEDLAKSRTLSSVYSLSPRPPLIPQKRFLKATESAAVREAEMKVERDEKGKQREHRKAGDESRDASDRPESARPNTAANRPNGNQQQGHSQSFLDSFYSIQSGSDSNPADSLRTGVKAAPPAAPSNTRPANSQPTNHSRSRSPVRSSTSPRSPNTSSGELPRFSEYFFPTPKPPLDWPNKKKSKSTANKKQNKSDANAELYPVEMSVDRPASATAAAMEYPFQPNRKVAYLYPKHPPATAPSQSNSQSQSSQPSDESLDPSDASPSVDVNVTRWLIQKRITQHYDELYTSSSEHEKRLRRHKQYTQSMLQQREQLRKELREAKEKKDWEPWLRLQAELKLQAQRRKVHWEFLQRMQAQQNRANSRPNSSWRRGREGVYSSGGDSSPPSPSSRILSNGEELQLIEREEQERIRDVERIESELTIWREQEEEIKRQQESDPIDLPRLQAAPHEAGHRFIVPESLIQAVRPQQRRMSVTETLIRQQIEAGQIGNIEDPKYNVAYAVDEPKKSPKQRSPGSGSPDKILARLLKLQERDLDDGLKSKRFNKPSIPRQEKMIRRRRFSILEENDHAHAHSKESEPWSGRAKPTIKTREFEDLERRHNELLRLTGGSDAKRGASRPATSAVEIERMEQSYISSILD